MKLSHLLFLGTAVLSLSCIFTTYYGFFMITKKFTETTQSNMLDPNNKSWFNQKTKVIMVLVDAFRFDYLTYNESLVGHEQLYQNRFKKIHEITTKSPECFTLLAARSDPPTWTIAKVPGLVTGNIYPKTGMLQSTDAARSIEDSVLHQVKESGKRAYFTGDPLWTEYFPDDFVNVANVRGFDIKDNTVDDETVNNIKKFIKEDQFDLIVAHLLSVDHTGHVYGLYDSRLGDQLAIVDQWMSEIIDEMDDNTMLIMLGDHGMTAEGTHGTDRPEETNTLIAAYHKKGFQKYHDNVHTSVMRSVNETLQQVKQQDVASTLSMLLGVPIPFSNLGQILNDLYPAGQIQDQEDCQGAAFWTKMLDDNYLNTLQVMNYYNFFKANTELLEEEIDRNIVSLSQKAISAYKEARELTENGKQCDGSLYADKITEAITLGQGLSDKIYKSILTNQDYNMFVIIQGLITILLVLISYVLIVQYVYSQGYEKSNDEIKGSAKKILKAMMIPGAIIFLIFLITLILNLKLVHSATTATLFVAFWIVGNLFAHLSKNSFPKTSLVHMIDPPSQRKLEHEKQKELGDIDDKKELDNIPLDINYVKSDVIENTLSDSNYRASIDSTKSDIQFETPNKITLFAFFKSLRTLFFLHTPLVSITALALTVTIIYCVQQTVFDSFIENYVQDHSPFIVLLALGFRIASLFGKKMIYFLMILAPFLTLLILIVKTDLIDFQSLEVRIIIGLLLIVDWVLSETKSVLNKFGVRQPWMYIHLLCFLVLAVYQMIDDRETYLIEILLPRAVWALIICLCVLKCILKVHGLAFMRNLQLCLVHFLLLLQGQTYVLPFAITLTLMRITAHLLSKYSKPSNYLFPFLVVMESYFGFFYLGQTDRTLPMVFKAGFIGLHDYNPVFSSLMVFMNVTTGFILGTMFVSYYNQSIDAETLEDTQVPLLGMEHTPEKVSVKITPRVVKKRNIIFYVFLISVVYFGAFIKCLAWRKEYLLEEEARTKYIVDSLIYMFLMMWGSVILAFE